MVYCAGNTPPYSMDYLADLHRLIRRDNVPFWNYQLPRTAGRLRVVPLFSDARRKRRGEDFEKRRGEDFEKTKEDGRGRERDSENEENWTLNRRKQRL